MIDADGWYEELMNAHRGLSDGQSIRLNCALVLLLADRVADSDELGRASPRRERPHSTKARGIF